jgi:hypothetical protein
MKLENAVNESPEAEDTVEEVKELTTETKWGAPIENSQLQIPTYDEQPYQQTELAVEEDQPPKRSKSEI